LRQFRASSRRNPIRSGRCGSFPTWLRLEQFRAARGCSFVHPTVQANSVSELIANAKSNPGKIAVASVGVGTAPHMYWELFRSLTGVEMLHVPYRGGGPALIDLLGGQVQMYFGTSASSIEYIRAGKLRALAVTTATRAAALPDVPAMAEFLPTYEASIYVGLAAPTGTSVEIIRTRNHHRAHRFGDVAADRRAWRHAPLAHDLRVREAHRR
jgi:Tripartite tricarboxylate transporter family receptor